jgi:hypothetical protein
MRLIVPKYAVRMIPHKMSRREVYGRFHFQNPHRMNKTMCKIVIASGRGHKYTNPGYSKIAQRRERWERKEIIDVPYKKMCGICLGAMLAEKAQMEMM